MGTQGAAQQPPRLLTVLRDIATYALGIAIVLKQAGIIFDAPEEVSLPLLAIGALCCNVPGILQVIAWRSGIAGRGSQPDAEQPESPSGRSSTSSGVDE